MPVSTADLIVPAMACLRVCILGAPPQVQDVAGLQALVGKVVRAFLETRWAWPRQFEQRTPYAFVLTDPRSSTIDKGGLKALAAELQVKLFGSDGEGDGEVSLLTFEGPDVEVHRFARLGEEEVRRILDDGPEVPAFEGLVERIVAARPAPAPDLALDDLDIEAAPEPEAPQIETPAPRSAPVQAGARLEPCYGGLYLTASRSFIGALALARQGRRGLPDLAAPQALPDLAAEAFDEACVQGAEAALGRDADGLLFVPLSFSSLVRPAGRRAYARFLCLLPVEQRGRLGAAVYDTPRAPSFFALSAIRRFLDPFFGEIDLYVGDPAFEVDRLPSSLAAGVTLVLPERDPATRLAAIRRFLQARDRYQKRRIRAGVAQVRTPAELEACLSLRAPLVGGPAVAPLAPRPPGLKAVAPEALPLGEP